MRGPDCFHEGLLDGEPACILKWSYSTTLKLGLCNKKLCTLIWLKANDCVPQGA